MVAAEEAVDSRLAQRTGLHAVLTLSLITALALTGLACAQARTPTALGASGVASDSAIARFEARYGKVSETYVEVTTTMADWREAEPNNTLGYAVGDDETAQTIHVYFVKGSFTADGPVWAPTEGSTANESASPLVWDEGRIIFNDEGHILNIRLWDSTKHGGDLGRGDPPIGPIFDED
jgi:hypothetical protein